jgi:hypothetical protein
VPAHHTVVAPQRDLWQKGDRPLPVHQAGAQRASRHRSRVLFWVLSAAFIASGALLAQPTRVDAAAPRVVLIVGPTGSKTSEYREAANRYASIAAGYGATVVKVYSPNATWSTVKSKAVGANLIIYLGHGNGWPSPYTYDPQYTTKDGFGLNSSAGNGDYNHKYYGEPYVATLDLAPNAVVILNRLCYASGNSEWGAGAPSVSTAKQRVDNYGAGFMRAGVKAVFAEGITRADHIIRSLFTTNRSMRQIFWSSPDNHPEYRNYIFDSVRTPGAEALMDPDFSKPGRYYRSVVGHMEITAAQWR